MVLIVFMLKGENTVNKHGKGCEINRRFLENIQF